MSGNVIVEVWLYEPYISQDYSVPASRDNPCKLGLPYSIAKNLVDCGVADYCTDPNSNQDCTDCPKGVRGARGAEGARGTDGAPGPNGSNGADGKDGKQGDPGQAGEMGYPGERNFCAGPPGEKGSTGAQGEPGLDGLNGENGQPGLRGRPGTEGLPGFQGSQGPTGDKGPRGDDATLCPDGALEIREIGNYRKRFITRNSDCQVTGDVIWECTPPIKCWRREFSETIDFNATDFKVRDDENGFGYEFPLSDGTVCRADFNFALPSVMPCRSTSCGHTGNPYEDTFPNINAYGIADDLPCQDIPVELIFDKPICGEIKISFIDVDQQSPDDIQPPCNEIIANINPEPDGFTGDIEEITGTPGSYTGVGMGNTDSNGDLCFSNLESVNGFNFTVRLAGRLSLGFGLAGTQTVKFVEMGTYQGNRFYDEQGNEIPEPQGWVDVPC